MENIADLYPDDLLQLSQRALNFEKRPHSQHIIEAYNPVCGDKFKLYLDIDNQHITQATFHGYGCVISKAATTVLIEKLKNLTLSEAEKAIETYFDTLNTEGVKPEGDAIFRPFLMVKKYPERLNCATLSWQAAKNYFQIEKENLKK
ncbi:MAG: iron-sulfur cluster assembly scaffold protein [Saprospiraceae bacterium]|nr:iron-sulfur cluster assembly scaffold protein [Saprospiraceae bacterium]